MTFLKDFCALIISGVALHNGLKTTQGFIAVYADNTIAKTLYNDNEIYKGYNAKMFLKQRQHNKISKVKYFNEGREAHICITIGAGIIGLEEYLRELGFRTSDNIDEWNMAESFFKEEKNKIDIKDGIIRSHSSDLGLKIAAAVTVSRVVLSGKYDCASNNFNEQTYQLRMENPLNMGVLQMIYSQLDHSTDQRLVYINGNLRIIQRARNGGSMIFGIHPSLDKSGINGFMNVKHLENFLQRQFTDSPDGPDLNTHLGGRVYLGGYNHSETPDLNLGDD